MSSWGNYDNAANAPYWAVNSTIVNAANTKIDASAPTAANVALLYGNTTANVYTQDETIGLFMVDAAEEQVQENAGSQPAHSGWNLKTTGQGGRQGRVTWETLVALADVKSDNNADDATLPDATITFVSQPQATRTVTANSQGLNSNTFSVSVTAVPSSATLTYNWQVANNNGGAWASVANGVPANTNYTGNTSSTLTVIPLDTTANNFVYRVVVTATNAGITSSTATATSSNGNIRVS